jgi:hypothetical protein
MNPFARLTAAHRKKLPLDVGDIVGLIDEWEVVE